MKRSLFTLAIAALSILIAGCSAGPTVDAKNCGGAVACPVGERSYHVQPPPDWDGKSPLPVLIHYHGWGRSGESVLRNDRIAPAAAERGILLVAPNGIFRSWRFWGDVDRDITFTEAMLDDLEKRYPIDRDRLYVNGFSYGGAMAWRIACDGPADIAAFFVSSGMLDAGEIETCAREAVTLRHVHGRRDRLMEFYTNGFDGPSGAVAPLLALNQCETTPSRRFREEAEMCETWQRCGNGAEVTLCLNDGGHRMPQTWIARSLDWAAGMTN